MLSAEIDEGRCLNPAFTRRLLQIQTATSKCTFRNLLSITEWLVQNNRSPRAIDSACVERCIKNEREILKWPPVLAVAILIPEITQQSNSLEGYGEGWLMSAYLYSWQLSSAATQCTSPLVPSISSFVHRIGAWEQLTDDSI